MDPDDHVCLCFHVSKRKIVNFCRREKPAHASLISDCLSAGTGCGWCIPFLKSLHNQVMTGAEHPDLPVSPHEYASNDAVYRKSGKKNTFDSNADAPQPASPVRPTALIIRTAGTNCDSELAHAFDLAGAIPTSVHLNDLIADPAILDRADLIGFPGGFSYGDDIAAGRIFANRLRHRLAQPLLAAVKRGVPIIGICNGFQVLVKLGLLPFPDDLPAGRQSATLADNLTGRFTDRWCSVEAPRDTACIWTRNLGAFDLPIAHGEGRFLPASPEILHRLQSNHQIALRYTTQTSTLNPQPSFPGNPNGSTDDIAAVCDPSGLVLGLMPHPERFTDPTNHPHWSRRPPEFLTQTTPGLRLFQNAVEHVKSTLAAAIKQVAV